MSLMLLSLAALLFSFLVLSLTAILGRGQWIVLPMGVFAGFILLAFFLQPLS